METPEQLSERVPNRGNAGAASATEARSGSRASSLAWARLLGCVRQQDRCGTAVAGKHATRAVRGWQGHGTRFSALVREVGQSGFFCVVDVVDACRGPV